MSRNEILCSKCLDLTDVKPVKALPLTRCDSCKKLGFGWLTDAQVKGGGSHGE